MKHLIKYKIFEAFESNILTKTLGFIKEKSQRQTFLNLLRNFTNNIDYPFSQLSDDFFEYLPYKKAIFKADMTGDEPCTGTSRSEFPEYAVEGAKCEAGKLKRKWGARTRDVVCPHCNGTGVEPKVSQVKLLKFWFDKDGRFITTSAVDGIMREQNTGQKFSQRLSDYNQVKALSHNDVLGLQTGQFISIDIEGERSIISYVFRENGRIYAVQNKRDGSTPSDRNWRNFGRYAWSLNGREYANAVLLEPKTIDDDKVEADPFEWNVGLSTRWSSPRVDTSKDLRKEITDAHFAIVFDLGKLKKTEFKSKSSIESEREVAKIGSKLDPSQSDEEIKKANIERYMATLSSRLDITSDISNCNKLVSRSIGYKNALWIVWTTDVYSDFLNLINSYIKLLRSDEDEKEYYVNDIKDRTNKIFKRGLKKSNDFESSLKAVKDRLKKEDKDTKYLELIDGLQKLSSVVYNTLSNRQIDCIEDFEVLVQTISGIRNIVKSDRYRLGRLGSYFLDYINRGYPDRAYAYLTDRYYTDVDGILEDLKIVTKIIERM